VVRPSDIYKMFRQILKETYREYKPNEIHVHEIVQCLRKSYYQRKYYSSEYTHLSDTKCVILGLGILVHRAIEELFSQMLGSTSEKVYEKVITVNGVEYKLVGTVDIAFDDTIVDIKTVNKIPDRPYDHHYYQLQLYMYLTGVHKAYVVYICKKDGRVKVFDIIRDQRTIDLLLERFSYYAVCLSSDTVPRAEESYLCRYCEYSLKCFSNNLKKVRK